jgi:glycosyltransferase involved in cell wall biosynthesis
MNHKNNIANYKNMTIHFKSINPFSDFIDIISKANVAICISNKEGYGHYINEARYMKKFIITMDYPPMNELIIDKDDNIEGGNGILLKKKNKFIKKNFKATKFNFTEAYPDFDELRDSIIWCIKHKHELRKWGKNGNKMFMNDKKYFEDIMDKFIKSKL